LSGMQPLLPLAGFPPSVMPESTSYHIVPGEDAVSSDYGGIPVGYFCE